MSEIDQEGSRKGERDDGSSRASLDFVDLASEKHGILAYPLRKPEEDPRWAVNIVRLWTVIASFLIVAISALLILGAVYD